MPRLGPRFSSNRAGPLAKHPPAEAGFGRRRTKMGAKTMTADMREKAPGSLFAALKRLKEQWLLIAAFASALFWARDLVEVYARLPTRLDNVEAEIAVLTDRLDLLEAERCGTGGQRRGRPPFPVPQAVMAVPALGVRSHRSMGVGRAGTEPFRGGSCEGIADAAALHLALDP